jgi:hypothetical protein
VTQYLVEAHRLLFPAPRNQCLLVVVVLVVVIGGAVVVVVVVVFAGLIVKRSERTEALPPPLG